MDRRAFRRKVLLRLLGSPLTLLPVIGGTTAMLAAWALGWDLAPAAFAGVTGLAVGAGTFLTRLVVGSESAAQAALVELEEEAEAERERRLDELHARLVEDGDPRTERLLQDLRTVSGELRQATDWQGRLNATSTFDVLRGVEDLFGQSVSLLEQTLPLQRLARRVNDAAAREPILQRREAVIDEIRDSLRQVSRVVAQLQEMSARKLGDTNQLARLRSDLEHGLEVARRVEERLEGLDLELDPRAVE